MRRALTLIEMIFTMVIVGLVFMVVPKILFVTNKSFETLVKEEALYNMMALAGIVTTLPWDENNTRSDAILQTQSPASLYRCDATTRFYRIGGFAGGRNCIGGGAATPLPGREDGDFNDLDDYDGYTLQTASAYGARYLLGVTVRYLSDPPPGNLVDLSTLSVAAGSSNIKEVNITVTNAPSNRRVPFRSSVSYHSANIGQTLINRRAWR